MNEFDSKNHDVQGSRQKKGKTIWDTPEKMLFLHGLEFN